MTFAEVKEEILRLSNEERREMFNLLLKLRADSNENWRAKIERRKEEMQAGEKVTREEAMRMLGLREEDIAASKT